MQLARVLCPHYSDLDFKFECLQIRQHAYYSGVGELIPFHIVQLMSFFDIRHAFDVQEMTYQKLFQNELHDSFKRIFTLWTPSLLILAFRHLFYKKINYI